MEWTADVTAGDWIRERLDDPWRATMHDVVPRGFAAYARIFHPATRSKPIGDEWPPLPYDDHRRAWEAFGTRGPEIETLPARWADAAAAFGTTLHGEAQWGALVRERGDEWNPTGWQQVAAPDGWQFDAPSEGRLDPAELAAAAELLAAHTMTPDDGFVALWEGWGGVTGGMGHGPSRVFLTFTSDDEGQADASATRHEDFLAHSARDQFESPFKPETWQPGILPDDVSKGPRLELPGRAHVLFRGGVSELTAPDWPRRVPWFDHERDAHGFGLELTESPSLVWPADRAWVLVTEVDYDSTVVGGPAELVAALCADPRLEALPIREGAALAWDADEVNR